MAANEPIDPRVRLAISQWPEDAPRGAVSTFCAEHGISRKSFYELRKRSSVDGPAAVLQPRSRRPRSSPSQLTDAVKVEAVQVRAALEASGLDYGPISVHDKMHAMGLDPVPSIGRARGPGGRRGRLRVLVPAGKELGIDGDLRHRDVGGRRASQAARRPAGELLAGSLLRPEDAVPAIAEAGADVADPDGLRIVLVEIPTDYPLRRDTRSM